MTAAKSDIAQQRAYYRRRAHRYRTAGGYYRQHMHLSFSMTAAKTRYHTVGGLLSGTVRYCTRMRGSPCVIAYTHARRQRRRHGSSRRAAHLAVSAHFRVSTHYQSTHCLSTMRVITFGDVICRCFCRFRRRLRRRFSGRFYRYML